MVHVDSQAEFYADPFPGPVHDVRGHGSIIDGRSFRAMCRCQCSRHRGQWLAITQTVKRRIEFRCIAFK